MKEATVSFSPPTSMNVLVLGSGETLGIMLVTDMPG